MFLEETGFYDADDKFSAFLFAAVLDDFTAGKSVGK